MNARKEDLIRGDEVFIFDGAFGTMLQARGLPPGACPEAWCLDCPDEVERVHRQYVDAGAQIIETCTFGGTPLRLSHFGLAHAAREINVAAVEIARRAASSRGVLVAASMGPLGLLVEPLGEVSFDEAYEQFAEQAEAFAEARPDFIIIETIADLNEMRAALLACRDRAPGIPVIAQMTFDSIGRTFTGTPPESAALVMEAMGAAVVGANCSVGPDLLVDVVARIAAATSRPVSVQPNAGLPHMRPSGLAEYPMGPEEFASYGPKLVAAGASIIGGCCGTTPEHISKLRSAVAGLRPPSRSAAPQLGITSRTQALFFADAELPVIVGERINPTGRSKLARDIVEGHFQLVRSEAAAQAKAGAQVLDINVGTPLADEPWAMREAVIAAQESTRLPLCLDSSSPEALESGLRAYAGRALVNSFSLEPGREVETLELAARYGAAVIGLPIDEKGIPATAEDRLRLACVLVESAEAHGIPRRSVIIDALAMPAGAKQEQAAETLKAIGLIRKELGCRTSLGISNVSFGLPAKPVLNSTFLMLAVASGLDLAIANPLDEALMAQVRAARVLLGRDVHAERYITSLGTAAPKSATRAASPPPSAPVADDTGDRLARIYDAILCGEKAVAVELVGEALSEGEDASHILDDALIPAIEETGRRFASGAYFLPELMLSAGAMQAATGVIRSSLGSKGDAPEPKGTVVIATVEGDIHDIGKNIVSMFLESNGYRVVDLGKNVKAADVLRGARRARADVVCLSALMTTTAPKMQESIELFSREGLDLPIIIGGAATSREYAMRIGASGYGRDAVEAAQEVERLLAERRSGGRSELAGGKE
ncbi:MAG: homocysteine S-methyltransferase family protein [Bacillota bacterium]|jgi:5-methyltetrahydrofolate--homocysteine methyltransferase